MHHRTLFSSAFHYSVVLDSAHAFRMCILCENTVFNITSVIGKIDPIIDMGHIVAFLISAFVIWRIRVFPQTTNIVEDNLN